MSHYSSRVDAATSLHGSLKSSDARDEWCTYVDTLNGLQVEPPVCGL